jgi:hypothetical protein
MQTHVVLLLVVFFAACTSTTTTPVITSDAGSSSPAASTCSTGPARSDDTEFVVKQPAKKDYSECVARCGYPGRAGGAFHTVDGLPSGACTSPGDLCGMDVQIRCPCPNISGPVHGMFCECTNGSWACFIRSQGGATCGPTTCGTDASAD